MLARNLPQMDPTTLSAELAVRLQHTDAAGVIFYPRLLEIEEELFERWLEAGGLHLRDMLVTRTLAPTPVVRCEADYRLPVRVGDRLTARLVAVDAGQSAFTLGWRFERAGAVAMEARVVRAAIDPAAGRSVELPAPLRAWIESSRAKLHG